MGFDCKIEGLDALKSKVKRARVELKNDLRAASLEAAAAGVQAVQDNHPYTDRTHDLTGEAHAEVAQGAGRDDNGKFTKGGGVDSEWSEFDGNAALMVWSSEYASFVDGRGYDPSNEPSGDFQFTPTAKVVAALVLDAATKEAVQRFKDTMNSR